MSPEWISRAARAIASMWTDTGARAEVVAACASDGPITPAMAEWAIDSALARFTESAIASLTGPRDLADAHTALLLGESVPIAPLRAVILAAARGSREILVRAPRRQRRFSAIVCRALGELGDEVRIELADVDSPHAFVAEMAPRGITHLIAYGDDATLETLTSTVDESIAIEGHGHGFGAIWVPGEFVDDARVIDAIAWDVAAYDQRGCLSPQAVFVETDDARAFGLALSDALERLAVRVPRGALDVDAAARVVQWQGAVAATCPAFHRLPYGSVAVLDGARLVGSPGARNIAVAPARDVDEFAAALAPEMAWITCIGSVGDPSSSRLPPHARRVAVGTMQDPPLDGPEDPRPPTVRRAQTPM